MKTKLLTLIMSLLVVVSASAQQYPVQGTLIVASPYPSYLSDYASPTMEKLILNLICTDINLVNQRVRLKVSIYQGSSLLAKSTDAIINEPMISLNGGIPLRLTSVELANYFKLENLQGIAPNAYAQTLREGVYSITVQVFDYFTGNKLSGDISQQFWLMLNDPPLLAAPLDKENIQQSTGINPQIAFQWTPRTTQVSNSEYEFTLVELWDDYGDPYQQFLASAPKYKTTTNNTTILYGITEPPLIPGHRYAWRVQAKAKQGLEDIGLYRNDGYSNIHTFKYAGQCDAIQSVNGQVKGSDRIYLEWQQPPQTMSLNGSGQSGMYKVAYRKYTTSNQWEWVELATTNGYINLTNLDGNTEYEIKVGNVCDNSLIGYSQPLRLRTQQTGTDLNVNCGQAPTIDLSNKTLLQKLSVYDVVTAADFPITITRAEGNANGWSGEGWVKVPYLADTKIHVVFNGIKVNTDYKLIDGYFETVYDASGKNIADIDQTISDVKELVIAGDDVGKMKTGADSTKYTVDFDIPENCSSCKFTPYEGGTISNDDSDKKNYGAGTIDFGEGKTLKVDTIPTTVKDKSGDIYKVEKTADCKGVVTTKISSTGGSELMAKADKKKIDSDKGKVIFSASTKQQFAFDSYIGAYGNNSNWDKRYEQLGDYRVSAKAIAPGASDVVTATIILSGGLKAENLKFVNTTGTVYVSKVVDKENGIYEVTLVGGPAGDAQEVYALYPQDGGKPLNLGKLLVASYAEKQLNVKLVPVNGATGFDVQKIKEKLNAIYNPVNVKVNVARADNFDTDVFDKAAGLTIGGKNFFNACSDDMKALNKAYASNVVKGSTYLFILNKAADGTVLGDMPRSSQFGYIFLAGNTEVERIAAHEIGHGVFDLQHVFDYKGITQGTTMPDNLMDYPAGNNLSKYQWDCLHDPALLAGMLDGKDDAEYETDGHYSTVYLVSLMLGMSSQQAKQLAEATEDPDTDIHSDTEFELDQTWAYPGKQQNIHSLTGGFHGVEEMMTAFKFLYTEKSNIKQQGQLLHRYGDTYAHTRLDNMLPESLKSENVSDKEKLSQYIDAWKNQEGTEMKSEIKPWIKFLNYYVNQYGYDFLTNESQQKAFLHGKTLIEYLHDVYLNQPTDKFIMYGNWFYTTEHLTADGPSPDYIYVRPKWYLTYVQNLAVLIAYKYQLDINKLDMSVFNKMVDFSTKNKCFMKGIIDYEIAKKEGRKYLYVPVYYSTIDRPLASADAIKTDYLKIAKEVVENTQKYLWEQGVGYSNIYVEEIKGTKKVNKNGTFDIQAYRITFQQ